MADLLTLDEAKRELNVTHDDDDLTILEKIAEASDVVLDYVTVEGAADWTPDTAPPRAKAAAKMALAALYDGNADPLSDQVRNLLRRLRDPALS